MHRKSRKSIKIYEFEVRILTGILRKIVLIHILFDVQKIQVPRL